MAILRFVQWRPGWQRNPSKTPRSCSPTTTSSLVSARRESRTPMSWFRVIGSSMARFPGIACKQDQVALGGQEAALLEGARQGFVDGDDAEVEAVEVMDPETITTQSPMSVSKTVGSPSLPETRSTARTGEEVLSLYWSIERERERRNRFVFLGS